MAPALTSHLVSQPHITDPDPTPLIPAPPPPNRQFRLSPAEIFLASAAPLFLFKALSSFKGHFQGHLLSFLLLGLPNLFS